MKNHVTFTALQYIVLKHVIIVMMFKHVIALFAILNKMMQAWACRQST